MAIETIQIINHFPGYEFVYDNRDKSYHNMYRDTDVGKGGYIISWPGIYTDVALLDVESLHPNSIRAMNCFGEYTKNFTDILDARVAIKHKDYDTARRLLNGRLAPFLKDESMAKDLAQALKIAINSVYGLTAAGFDNPFRDPRNKNNIVALRGALFMRTLQDEITERGFQIVAIKTDSIKIANATKEIIDFCMEFAASYGYKFKHEATYDRMCQINDADYIARYKNVDWCKKMYGYIPDDNEEHPGEWTATGKQFSIPYVFKTLFSKEPIEFGDLCETKEVKSALYLDMNESLPDVTEYEALKALRQKDKDSLSKKKLSVLESYSDISDEELDARIAEGHCYQFVGKVGSFCPIKPNCGGGELLREAKATDGSTKYDSATGASGFKWLEAEAVELLGKEDCIDRSYHATLVDNAVRAISEYGDFEWFVSDGDVETDDELPWVAECGKRSCYPCEHFNNDEFDVDCSLGHDISDVAYTEAKKKQNKLK